MMWGFFGTTTLLGVLVAPYMTPIPTTTPRETWIRYYRHVDGLFGPFRSDLGV